MHSHYVPLKSQRIAVGNRQRHKLRLESDERDRPIVPQNGAPYLGPLKVKAEFYDLELRAMIMNRQGLDMQVLSHASSYFFYWLAPEKPFEFAGWFNGTTAVAVKSSPQRFVALASVPMQDSFQAAFEAERAITELGLCGVESLLTKPPSEYIKLLYFDTSKMALEYLMANFDSRCVVLGSDYAYDMGDPKPCKR